MEKQILKKNTTIYDIAKVLNVTVSTVSRALNGFPAISEKTRKRVFETAEKLNYSPNRLASALKSGKTFIVGVIVPSVQSHFFASVIHSIEEGLKDSGYRIILYQSNELVEDEIKGVKTLLEAQVDGIIASLSLETADNVSHFQNMIKQNKPLVLFDRVSTKLKVPTITLNDFRAGFLVTEYLIQLGYKKIAFITTIQPIKIFIDRLEGYRAAMKAFNLPIHDEHIIFGGLSIKDGRYGASKLLRAEVIPEAIIAGDDFTALGVLKKLKEVNETPPKIGLVGFSNEAFSAYVSPSLSTVDQHPNQMGLDCAEMFLQMIKQGNPYDDIRNLVFEPTLVERQSTGSCFTSV